MAWSPRKVCAAQGCGRLTSGRWCERHAAEASASARDADRRRGSARARGYDAQWEKARAAYLAAHPLCVAHEGRGQVRASRVVDHIVPHRGDMALFWDEANWQALCKPCHDAKTAAEDGGFGHRPSGAAASAAPSGRGRGV